MEYPWCYTHISRVLDCNQIHSLFCWHCLVLATSELTKLSPSYSKQWVGGFSLFSLLSLCFIFSFCNCKRSQSQRLLYFKDSTSMSGSQIKPKDLFMMQPSRLTKCRISYTDFSKDATEFNGYDVTGDKLQACKLYQLSRSLANHDVASRIVQQSFGIWSKSLSL